MLTEIFAVAGPVQHVKIIPDRNYQHGGLNYGFVEYIDMRAAETALQTLNGRKIFDTEIRVNWAYQGSQNKEDTSNHFHVFVGDLSPEVNDEVLGKAFSAFGTLSDARVMWDMNSGKSRGYGFLAFRDKTDAEQAIATMNGEWLGSRAIRVNWANQKTQGAPAPGQGGPVGGTTQPPRPVGTAPAPINFQGGPLSYETVLNQTPAYNTTVYVGNLVPYTTQADLIPLFQSIGYLSEIRMQADRGFAFVKLDTHEHAALAIVQLQGQMINGRPIKCSWGKDRAAGDTSQPGGPLSPPATAGVTPYPNMVQILLSFLISFEPFCSLSTVCRSRQLIASMALVRTVVFRMLKHQAKQQQLLVVRLALPLHKGLPERFSKDKERMRPRPRNGEQTFIRNIGEVCLENCRFNLTAF
jgi:nucleolysin TIA-1/TIAR